MSEIDELPEERVPDWLLRDASGIAVIPGVESFLEADGLDQPSWLVFYKVRAASDCYLDPGPP